MPEVIRKNRERILHTRLREEAVQAAMFVAQDKGVTGEEPLSPSVRSQKSHSSTHKKAEELRSKRHEN